MGTKKQQALFYGIILLLFGFIYFLNIHYPLFTDDWYFSFVRDGSETITGFSDIIRNQYEYYFTWGGRFIVHVIVQTLLWIGEGWADIINSLVYVFMVLVIYFLALDRQKHNIMLLALIVVFSWFFNPAFGQSVLWLTGCVNYLWTALFSFLFIYPFCAHYRHPQTKNSALKTGLFFVAGIVAGWTSESISVVLLFFTVALLILMKYERKSMPRWMISGLAGAIIGSITVVAAPGNYLRYKLTIEQERIKSESTLDFYLQRFSVVADEFVKYGLIPSLVFLSVLALFLYTSRKEKKTTVLRLSLLFFATSTVYVLVMTAAPIFPERTWLGILSFTISGIALLYANLNWTNRIIKWSNYTLLAVALLAFGFSYYRGAKETVRIGAIFSERAEYIRKQKEKGIENITIHGRFISNPSRFNVVPKLYDMSPDSTNWINVLYAKYNHVTSVIIVDDKITKED